MSSADKPSQPAASIGANKELYGRWFEEVVSGGDLALADALLGPGYRLHFPGKPEPLDGDVVSQSPPLPPRTVSVVPPVPRRAGRGS